jgi:uncharacterized Fe-S cluster-containing protein
VKSDPARHLPGHNCGACGHARCDSFAAALAEGRAGVTDCLVLQQERYSGQRRLLEELFGGRERERVGPRPEKPVGLIDGYEADFVLAPLRGEGSCREILMQVTPSAVGAGDVIRYRPLGCPVTHFARIIEKRDGLLVVHVVGPRHRLGDESFNFAEIGLCMVIGFEGEVRGTPPAVGETVRFMPAECMMQKVHSGVVVSCEGKRVRLEGIDLKVWAPPVKK